MNKILEAVKDWVKEIVFECISENAKNQDGDVNDHEARIADIERRLDTAQVTIEL